MWYLYDNSKYITLAMSNCLEEIGKLYIEFYKDYHSNIIIFYKEI